MQDLRYAWRVLRRSPGFAAVAIAALALGIGANTAVFSVVDAVLLHPLPYDQPDRIVMIWEDASHQGFPENSIAPANWLDWRKQNTVFTSIATIRLMTHNLTGAGAPESIVGRRVTADFWDILGTRPLLGRVFTEAEDPVNAKVVVLSYGLWQRRWAGDRGVIGRKVLLTDEPFEIIGVMPPGFVFPERRNEIWTPSELTPELMARRGSHFLSCVARLKPGVTLEQAKSEMRVIAKRLEQQYPDTNYKIGTVVVPLRDQLAGNLRIALWVLLGASGCVLLIACANLANLLLARAAGRQQEIAIRAALGAGRGRIIRQMLMESLVLASLGAIAGLGLARLGMVGLQRLIPTGFDQPALTLDLRVLLFTIALTVATAIAFGLAPAYASSGGSLHGTLKQGARGLAGGPQAWFRDGLIVAQTAMALILLSSAGLTIQTLDRLQRIDTGIRTESILTMATDIPRSRYPDAKPEKRERFFNAVVEKVRKIPGVVDAGYTSALP